MDQSTPKDAAAAVSALYFAALLMALFNVRFTGFRLYVPVGIACLARGISYATRAAFMTTPNFGYMAASRATAAIGLGISIAMCSCFLVIWLRNAQPNHQPPMVTRIINPLCKALVACVIICGPILGVIAAAVMYAKPGDLALYAHGLQIRQASAAGFLAVECIIAILITYTAISWLTGTTRHHQQQQQQQQQRLSWQPQLQGDGLILLLLACNLLLLWAAAANLAATVHTEIILETTLFFTVMALPELIVVFIWSWPALVAKIALGGRFQQWRQQQQQQQQQGAKGLVGVDPEEGGSRSDETCDAEAITTDAPVGSKELQLTQQQQ